MSILLFGAGRSSLYFIEYILNVCHKHSWMLSIADVHFDNLPEQIQIDQHIRLEKTNIEDSSAREQLVQRHDFIVSLLPVKFHILIANDCIQFGKPFANASYVTDELKSLEPQIIKKNLLFAGELGLDPGLDHMSAMETIHNLQEKGARIISFKSFTGGLIDPESDNNPWHYKISWNPRNIVLAGQGIAQYKLNGDIAYVPYHQLFRQISKLKISGLGVYEGYPNRDSLHYEELYGLEGVQTLMRGTIRASGFCEAWNILIQCGYTNDTLVLDTNVLSMKQITARFFPFPVKTCTVRDLEKHIGYKISAKALHSLKWLELDSDIFLKKGELTPAQILEYWLLEKWKLEPSDKDMVIMQHQYVYELEGERYTMTSTLRDIGKDNHHTSMSKLVGLPLAIYVKCYLLGKISGKGYKIPVTEEYYKPILAELSQLGIEFKHVVRKQRK